MRTSTTSLHELVRMAMEHSPIQNDARRARRQRKLGTDAACLRCGTTTPEVLLRANRSLLDDHHVVGRAHDVALTVPLCRNCHAILTEGQLAHGVDLRHGQERTAPEMVAAILDALAAFFYALAEAASRWAGQLRDHIEALDAHCPQWRYGEVEP